ncbi:uncharacterized protein [Zea mays]|uniref:uncharacterized protein n=1 Tax=Zea mays TaxID=4577 RepID=UPI000C6C55CD|nr:uncharacterized protein LOC111589802 [Zea mays]|eukprot:XP_023156490.1 uncharacterized protein LOC111589802 [Zea mays]
MEGSLQPLPSPPQSMDAPALRHAHLESRSLTLLPGPHPSRFPPHPGAPTTPLHGAQAKALWGPFAAWGTNQRGRLASARSSWPRDHAVGCTGSTDCPICVHNQVMKHELYISFQVPSSVTLNILSNGFRLSSSDSSPSR